MLRIRHKRIECIGCMFCHEVAPNYWIMDDEGLAQLINVTGERDEWQLAEGFDDDREALKEAADNCPVQIIKVE